MYTCKNCNQQHDGSYKNKNFCSIHCSRSYASKKANPKNISLGVLKISKHKIKCMKCGKEIEVFGSVMNSLCIECRMQNIRTCPVCGKKHKLTKDSVCYRYKLIPTLIKYFNFDKSKLKTLNAITEFNRIKEEIYDLYWNQGKSINELMMIYHYNSNNAMNFSKIMNSMGIERRSLSDSAVLLIKNHKKDIPINYKYKSGYHISWEGKKFWYRSSYELDYANELDQKKIKYEVESLRIEYVKSFDKKKHIAIPDFYLPDNNELIEIKSSYTYNDIDIHDKFKRYIELGYKVKLIYEHIEIPIDKELNWSLPIPNNSH